jgi:hypothetical protein
MLAHVVDLPARVARQQLHNHVSRHRHDAVVRVGRVVVPHHHNHLLLRQLHPATCASRQAARRQQVRVAGGHALLVHGRLQHCHGQLCCEARTKPNKAAVQGLAAAHVRNCLAHPACSHCGASGRVASSTKTVSSASCSVLGRWRTPAIAHPMLMLASRQQLPSGGALTLASFRQPSSCGSCSCTLLSLHTNCASCCLLRACTAAASCGITAGADVEDVQLLWV